ncbi:MAG TPA: lytic transglycosylase domain-containing protein, partial [Allosphingosinicella sp.]
RTAEALAAARGAWQSGDLGQYDEQLIFSRFGSQLTAADHDRRIDALLFDKRASDAHRMLPWSTPGRRGAHSARIAMQAKQPDAEARYQAVIGQVTTDAGLMMDRARYLRDRGYEQAARDLFARSHNFTHKPADPDRFLDMMVLLSKAAAGSRQWDTAYRIASQVDDLFPAGADISLKSYDIRDKYTTLTWTAGTVVLERMNRARDAIRMFDKYAGAGRSLQVKTKGWYWAGRASAQSGDHLRARSYFERASATPELFYGQLALERLGRRVTSPVAASISPSPAQRSAFAAKPLVQAARALGDMGRWSDQSLFVRAIAEQAETESERVLAAEFGRTIGRQDLGVWVAREARNKGQSFYDPAGFPEISLPSAYAQYWALAHGITRQESSFDRAAVSHAGARGLMQLMPGTARETAGKIGLPYDFGRLTSDPSYNIMLGSSYFARLLDEWGGHAPLAVASYNAGAGNVRRWLRENGDPRGGTDIVTWIEAIPYSETRNYVQRVLENAVVYEAMRAQRHGGRPNRLSYYLGKSGPG